MTSNPSEPSGGGATNKLVATGLIGLALASGAIVIATHVLRVFTPAGQRWDDAAYLEARLTAPGAQQACEWILSTLTVPTIALGLAALLLVSVVRRQILVGVAIVAAFAIAIVLAEILAQVIARPDLAPALTALVDDDSANTFPSGHAAIATGLGLGFIMVSSRRWRGWVAVGGLAFATAIACATVIAGWHRPSDAVGGVALSTGWLALVGWLLARQRGTRAHPITGRSAAAAGVTIMILALASVGMLATIGPERFLLAFATAEALIILGTAAAFAGMVLSLRGISLDR